MMNCFCSLCPVHKNPATFVTLYSCCEVALLAEEMHHASNIGNGKKVFTWPRDKNKHINYVPQTILYAIVMLHTGQVYLFTNVAN